MKNQKITVGEILEGVKSGEIIRETFQRTPSHDTKKALEILNNIRCGRYAGGLTFAEIAENGKMSIIDGSSRIKDLENFVADAVFDTETKTEKEETDAGTKTIKTKVNRTFSNMSEVEKHAFMSYSFPLVVLENTTLAERVDAFVNVNSSVALSSIQKNKGVISDKLNEIIQVTLDAPIIQRVFTKRQVQKDEVVAWVYVVLANIYDKYTATNKKLVEAVNGLDLSEFDLTKYTNALFLFDDIEIEINKYCLASHIVNLYNSVVEIEGFEKFDNRIVFSVVTSGANSVPANEGRLSKSMQLLNKILGVSVKTGKPTKKAEAVEVVSLEEIAE